MARGCVFLDRDGVLIKTHVRNAKPYAISSMDDYEVLDGVVAGIDALRKKGFLLIGVTNQPDVANGKTARSVVDEINERLKTDLGLDEIYTCYHRREDRCDCRKPKTGLFEQACQDFDVDVTKSYMVGDRISDVEAGQNMSVRTIFIDFSYAETTAHRADLTVQNFLEATTCIL